MVRKKRSTFRRQRNMSTTNAAVLARKKLHEELHSGKPWLAQRARRLLGR